MTRISILAQVRAHLRDFDSDWVEVALAAAEAVPVNDDTDAYMKAVCTSVATAFKSLIDDKDKRTRVRNRRTDALADAIKRFEALADDGVRH